MARFTMLALLVLAFAPAAQAGDCCDRCDHCGCACQPRKVCRLVCEMKKVPKTVYACECEDFCIPCPSEKCGTKCVCPDECGCSLFAHCHKAPVYRPTGAQIHTRTKLVKKIEMKEVPTYKWVVEYVCDRCGGCPSSQQDQSAEAYEATPELTAPAPMPMPVKPASLWEMVRGSK